MQYYIHYSFRDSLGWLVFMIFGFFNSNPNQLSSNANISTCAVVFFRAHHTLAFAEMAPDEDYSTVVEMLGFASGWN